LIYLLIDRLIISLQELWRRWSDNSKVLAWRLLEYPASPGLIYEKYAVKWTRSAILQTARQHSWSTRKKCSSI